MSKSTFTNRHGKRITVDDDSDQVIIESPASSVPLPDEPEPTAPKKSKKKQEKDPSLEVSEPAAPLFETESLPVPAEPKKKNRIKAGRILRTVAVLMAVAIIGLIIFTQTNAEQFSRAENTMKSAVSKARAINLKTEVSLTETVKQLTAALPDLACPSSSFELSSASREAKQKCVATERAYRDIRNEVLELGVMANYSEKMTTALAPALTNPSDGNFAEIPTYANNWQAARESLKAIQPPVRIQKGHAAVMNAVATTAAAWQKLSEANTSQDGQGYISARTELSAAYESLRNASDQILVNILPYQKTLSNKLSLFK